MPGLITGLDVLRATPRCSAIDPSALVKRKLKADGCRVLESTAFSGSKTCDTLTYPQLGDLARREAGVQPLGARMGRELTREDLLKRITIDPGVCFGKPCIRGTRIWVSLIVDNLADGIPEQEILAAYPSLTRDDIRAALVYAAELTHDRYIAFDTEAPDEIQTR